MHAFKVHMHAHAIRPSLVPNVGGLSLARHLLGKHLLPTAISPSLTPFDLDVPHDHVLAHDARARAHRRHARAFETYTISTCMRTLNTHEQAGRVTHWMPRLRHPLPRLKRETEGVLLIFSFQCPLPPLASNARRKGLSRSRIFVGFALAFVYTLHIHIRYVMATIHIC